MSYSVCLGLLVLLGGVFARARSIPENFVPDNLRKEFESIQSDLGLTDPVVNRKPPFDSVLEAIGTACQRKEDIHLMNDTLNIYMKIFSKILHQHHGRNQTEGLLDLVNQSKKEMVKETLEKLHKKMEKLRSRLSYNPNRENALSELNRIKDELDNPLMQKKVLAQFLRIFQAASNVAQPASHGNASPA